MGPWLLATVVESRAEIPAMTTALAELMPEKDWKSTVVAEPPTMELSVARSAMTWPRTRTGAIKSNHPRLFRKYLTGQGDYLVPRGRQSWSCASRD